MRTLSDLCRAKPLCKTQDLGPAVRKASFVEILSKLLWVYPDLFNRITPSPPIILPSCSLEKPIRVIRFCLQKALKRREVAAADKGEVECGQLLASKVACQYPKPPSQHGVFHGNLARSCSAMLANPLGVSLARDRRSARRPRGCSLDISKT